MAWFRPTSNTANGWATPTNAYDGNTGTSASFAISTLWSPYLEMFFASTEINSVRVYTSTSNTQVSSMEIDVYYGGSWINVYQTEPLTAGAYYTADLGADYYATGIRIRFYRSGSGGTRNANVHDTELFQVEKLPITISPSSISSAEAFGTPHIQIPISPSGIPSQEAFGTPTVSSALTIITPIGIASAENFGTPQMVYPKLILHLDANSIVGLLDNDLISTWSDISGQGNNAIQTVEAAKPIYKTNVINGKPTVRFDGINDWLQIQSLLISNLVGKTIIVLMRTTSTNMQQVIFHNRGSATGDDVGSSLSLVFGGSYPSGPGEPGVVSYGLDSSAVYIGIRTEQQINDGQPHIISAVWNGQSGVGVASGQFSLNIDKNFPTTISTTIGTPRVAPLTGKDYAEIGRHNPWATFMQGDISEMLIYDKALSVQEQENIESYLLGKWIPLNITPMGISSAEIFGTPSINYGTLLITPTGILSAESFGTPILNVGALGALNVTPQSILSSEVFGTPLLTYGVLIITPQSIPSSEIFGTPIIQIGVLQTINITPQSILSSEAFGTPLIVMPITITPTSIPSAESFGIPFVGEYEVGYISMGGFNSQLFNIAPFNASSRDLKEADGWINKIRKMIKFIWK